MLIEHNTQSCHHAHQCPHHRRLITFLVNPFPSKPAVQKVPEEEEEGEHRGEGVLHVPCVLKERNLQRPLQLPVDSCQEPNQKVYEGQEDKGAKTVCFCLLHKFKELEVKEVKGSYVGVADGSKRTNALALYSGR